GRQRANLLDLGAVAQPIGVGVGRVGHVGAELARAVGSWAAALLQLLGVGQAVAVAISAAIVACEWLSVGARQRLRLADSDGAAGKEGCFGRRLLVRIHLRLLAERLDRVLLSLSLGDLGLLLRL